MTTLSKITLDNLNTKYNKQDVNYNKYINLLITKLNKENLYIEDDLLRYPLYDNMDDVLSCIRDSNRDYNSMKFISTLLYYVCDYDKNSEYRTYKFRTFLHNLKSVTTFNPVSDIDFFNTKDLLIIKHKPNIFEEFVISKVLNNLRKDIPNFAYTFIINSCNITNNINNTENIVCPFNFMFLKDIYMENNINNTSIIMEKVKGEPLISILETLTLQEFYDIILQTCLALSYAYDKYKFTHYDLHGGNIIINKRDYISTYKYKYKGQDVYLTTNILVSIIDFGRAYVEYEDISLSNINSDGFMNSSFVLYDFIFLIWYCRNYNTILKNFIIDILKFFLNDDIITYHNKNNNIFIHIEYEKHLANINYNDIIFILINIANNYKLTTKLSLTNYNSPTNSVCLEKINSFLNRNYIEFNDCMGFYDFYLKFKENIIHNEKNIILFKINTKSYVAHFKYIDYINNDIKYLEIFIQQFINFLTEIYNNYDIINKNILNFVEDNYYIIKYTSTTILKVINIYNNPDNIKNLLLTLYESKILNIHIDMNSYMNIFSLKYNIKLF